MLLVSHIPCNYESAIERYSVTAYVNCYVPANIHSSVHNSNRQIVAAIFLANLNNH